MASKTAYYKRYNGSDWDTIYFWTLSGVVAESDEKWFMKPSNTVNGKKFAKTGGVTLYGSDITLGNPASGTTTGITIGADTDFNLGMGSDSSSTVTANFGLVLNAVAYLDEYLKGADTALGTRIKKIEDAYGSDGDIITTSNMGTKITKVGTVSSGTWQGTAIADAYIASASKWDGKQDKLTFDTTPTANSSNPVTSDGIKTAIDIVAAIAQGKTNTYVITSGSVSSDPNVVNDEFFMLQTSEKTQVSITIGSLTRCINTVNGKTVYLTDLKVGDIILTQEANVKDFYVGMIGDGVIMFYEIDSDKPDLTDYAKTSAVTSAISAAIGNLDSSKDAGSGKYLQSITITDGKITGGTVGTVPTSLPASNTTGDYSSTGTAPVNGTAVNKALSQSLTTVTSSSNGVSVSLSGTIQKPTVSVLTQTGEISSSEGRVVSGASVYSHVAARATKIFYADSASSVTGMIDGDICIEC